MNGEQNPTDRFLVEQYKSGATSVLPLLVKRWHKIFCQKAFWITRNKDMAKDIAQDSWLIIIDKLHTLKNTDNFKSWAFRIIYTKAIDAIKLNNRENRNLKFIDVSKSNEVPEEDNRIFIKRALLKAIRQLPKEKQDIIRLFYTEEYSLNEISSFLNIPLGTVKSRLFQAREKLKSILKEVNYEK